MKDSLWFTLAILIAGALNASGQLPYDPKPWLADLSEMHDAFSAKYSNFEWAVFDHEIDMAALFEDAQKRIEAGNNDADARAAFDRLIRRVGDPHVELHWPTHGAQYNAPQLPCANYDEIRAAKPLAAYSRGYTAIETQRSDILPIGTITSGKHRVGVIKIPSFTPTAFPSLCREALTTLGVPADKTCDNACSDRIEEWAEAQINEGFIAQIGVLERAKIDTLLVDLAGNSGGTEWADAAARMVTATRLKSGRIEFMRGPHWVKELGDLEDDLRTAARAASPEDREVLLKFAGEAAAKKKVAATPCDAMSIWKGKHPSCARLGEGFFMTGPMASADPTALRDKPWAAKVFTPMEFQYREGLWRGPLIVLVDSASASSSEEFASQLQDNHAAVIISSL